jgi:transposase InsO family protein
LRVEEKVALVEEHRDTYGLNRCLKALNLSKGTWHYRRRSKPGRWTKDEVLKERIVKVIEEHPGYGYRRIGRELAGRHAERVNHKRLRRVLKSYELGLRRCVPRSKPSAVQRLVATAGRSADLVKGRSFEVLEAFSTDFKEILYDEGQKKAHLMVLLDLKSRWAGGWAMGDARNRCVALQALDDLRKNISSLGQRLSGVVIHHDKDSVYTSYRWLEELLLKERVRVSYAQRGARDNPWIESFWGRFSTENGELILQAETEEEVRKIVTEQLEYYNRKRRHSALDYRRPYEVMLATTTGEDTLPKL